VVDKEFRPRCSSFPFLQHNWRRPLQHIEVEDNEEVAPLHDGGSGGLRTMCIFNNESLSTDVMVIW